MATSQTTKLYVDLQCHSNLYLAASSNVIANCNDLTKIFYE